VSLIGGALTPLVGSDVVCDEFNSTSSPCPTLTPQIEVPEYLSPDKSGQPTGERDRPGILILPRIFSSRNSPPRESSRLLGYHHGRAFRAPISLGLHISARSAVP
jgi:hypothetical protein